MIVILGPDHAGKTTLTKDVLDGAMLSDANIYPSKGSRETSRYLDSYFRIQLGGRHHMDWLRYLKEQLGALGILFTSTYPKLAKRNSDDYTSSWLISRTSPLLTAQRRRWYPSGSKVVPSDLALSPVSLANWFMGDGSSSWQKYDAVMVTLATHSFSRCDVDRLRCEMGKLVIHTGVANYSDYDVITVLQDSVDLLMRTIEPFIVPSFEYKIKYRGRQ